MNAQVPNFSPQERLREAGCSIKNHLQIHTHIPSLLDSLNLVSLQRTGSVQIHCAATRLHSRDKETFQRNQALYPLTSHINTQTQSSSGRGEKVKSIASGHPRWPLPGKIHS